MERRALVVCSVVGFLGLVSAALGFAAEAERIKISQVSQESPGVCIYPRSPAFALGFTAAIALLIAQIIINASTGCICCRSSYPSNTNWAITLTCFILSWFSFVFAFLLLLGGAALNDRHTMDSMYFGYYYCYVVKPGVFAGAAVLSLVCIALGILYYLTLTSGKSQDGQWSGGPGVPTQTGIAMGQPQIPPTAQGPVFVHEDTYIRQHFT